MKFIEIIFIIFFVFTTLAYTDPVIVAGGSDNDYESWLQRINDGRIMLMFCKNPDFTAGDLYVTFSENDGQTWNDPTLIISGTADQTLMSFTQMSDSSFQMFYSSNETGTYHIHSAISNDGINWTPQGQLDLGWSSYSMVYDPNINMCADGTLIMIYVVYGSGIYVTRTDEYGIWDTQHRLIDTSSYRPRIIQTNDGKFAVAFHKRNGPSQYDYDVFVRYSTDFDTWSDPQQISTNNNSHDAFIAQDDNGTLYVYYAKYTDGSYKLRRKTSTDMVTWSEEEIITNPILNDTQPHLFIENTSIYMSWAHEVIANVNHDVYFEKFDNAVISTDEPNPYIDNNISCYPNPLGKYAHTLSINYSMNKQGFVAIHLYNLRGQLIQTLLHNKKDIGHHTLSFDAHDLSAGMYFMKLSIDGVDKGVTKFVVMK